MEDSYAHLPASICLTCFMQAKKKLKQGKISSFFSATPNQQPAKDATPTPTPPTPAAEPTASSREDSSESPLLPGGRSSLKVLGVRFGIGGDPKHNNEGRAITVEYEKVCYGPGMLNERRRDERGPSSGEEAL